jgi:hypothetical protein
MEYLEGGEVFQLMRAVKKFDLNQARFIIS